MGNAGFRAARPLLKWGLVGLVAARASLRSAHGRVGRGEWRALGRLASAGLVGGADLLGVGADGRQRGGLQPQRWGRMWALNIDICQGFPSGDNDSVGREGLDV